MNLKINNYEKKHQLIWNEFVKNSRNGLFFFEREFMEYHSDRFVDFSLLVFKETKLIAILPANISQNTVFSHQGLTFGGIILKENTNYNTIKSIFNTIINFLQLKGIKKLVIKTPPSFYCSEMNEELLYLSNNFNCTIENSCTSVINKSNTIRFSKTILAESKKALKNNIQIKKTEDLETYWNKLLIPRLKERYQNSPTHSLKEILFLKEKFPERFSLHGAFLDDKMIAGTLLFHFNKVDKIQYISSIEGYNKLGALQLLNKTLIENSNKPYVDFGNSIEPSTNKINESLLLWKEFFNAKMTATFTFNFEF